MINLNMKVTKISENPNVYGIVMDRAQFLKTG